MHPQSKQCAQCGATFHPTPGRSSAQWERQRFCSCDVMWLSYAAMPDADYCKRCNRARWRETHYERAARHGARFDVIDPIRIFERDHWRCQICRRKTERTGWPNPKRATLDHIVPLARGGQHVESNLQCACWLCNVRKGARSANDQLRLAV